MLDKKIFFKKTSFLKSYNKFNKTKINFCFIKFIIILEYFLYSLIVKVPRGTFIYFYLPSITNNTFISFTTKLLKSTMPVKNSIATSIDGLRNITLANVSGGSYMAAFMPIFTFVTSDTGSGYPVGSKTQIILNAKYFLNTAKIENSASYGSKTGYFPPNATRSSTVAHEFGHYLSYVALLNYYESEGVNYGRFNKSQSCKILFSRKQYVGAIFKRPALWKGRKGIISVYNHFALG